MTARQLQSLARQHGTPVVVVDHDILRANYAKFRRYLPKIQAYYAVKANPAPEIIRTLYGAGASFDVASMPEFMLVYENIRHLPPEAEKKIISSRITVNRFHIELTPQDIAGLLSGLASEIRYTEDRTMARAFEELRQKLDKLETGPA